MTRRAVALRIAMNAVTEQMDIATTRIWTSTMSTRGKNLVNWGWVEKSLAESMTGVAPDGLLQTHGENTTYHI